MGWMVCVLADPHDVSLFGERGGVGVRPRRAARLPTAHALLRFHNLAKHKHQVGLPLLHLWNT